MKAADLLPGWASDLVTFADGGQVIERDDCLVLRTPGNPAHDWGNGLVVPLALAEALGEVQEPPRGCVEVRPIQWPVAIGLYRSLGLRRRRHRMGCRTDSSRGPCSVNAA